VDWNYRIKQQSDGRKYPNPKSSPLSVSFGAEKNTSGADENSQKNIEEIWPSTCGCNEEGDYAYSKKYILSIHYAFQFESLSSSL
jgi:hypothetical protein